LKNSALTVSSDSANYQNLWQFTHTNFIIQSPTTKPTGHEHGSSIISIIRNRYQATTIERKQIQKNLSVI
jgi:hypothetical protein